MNNSWQLQEAKNKLSRVIDRALTQGPQTITRRGVETAVVLSASDYKKLRRTKTKPGSSLLEFFRTSPLVGVPGLRFDRQKDYPRDRLKL